MIYGGNLLEQINLQLWAFGISIFAMLTLLVKHVVTIITSDENSERRTFYASATWLVGALLLFVAAVVLSFALNFSLQRGYRISDSIEHWGQMGDFFGGMLNPVLAFASFIALLYTIKLQSREMAETREELKQARIAQQSAAETASAKLAQEKDLFEYQTLQRLLLAQVETLDNIFGLNTLSHSLVQIQDLILGHHFKASKNNSTNMWSQIDAIIEKQLNIARTSTHAGNHFLHVCQAKSLIQSCSIFATRLGMLGDDSMLAHMAKKVGFHCCISSFTMAGRTNALDTSSEVLAGAIANYWRSVSIDPIDTPQN